MLGPRTSRMVSWNPAAGVVAGRIASSCLFRMTYEIGAIRAARIHVSGSGKSSKSGTDRLRSPNRESLARQQRRASTVAHARRYRSSR